MEKGREYILQNVAAATQLFGAVAGIRVQIILPPKPGANSDCTGTCSFCRWLQEAGASQINCHALVTKAGKTAAELGQKHLFFCQTGFVHFVSPVLWRGELIATAVGGPIVLAPSSETAAALILERFQMSGALLEETIKRIISLPAIAPEKISQSAELFRMVVSHASNCCRQSASSIQDVPLPLGYFATLEAELTAAIQANSKSKIMSEIGNMLDYILTTQAKHKTIAKNLCLELALLLSQIAAAFGKQSGDLSGTLYPQLTRLEKSTGIAEMRLCMQKVAEYFTDNVLSDPSIRHNDVIIHTIDYIRQNYMMKITLESAASHVFLSPSYLSKIFKEEIGLNFNNYLNKVRIEHAKRLLLNDNVDLINIATLVGYEDQSYFSKVFKRITGVTPKKFKLSKGSVNLTMTEQP